MKFSTIKISASYGGICSTPAYYVSIFDEGLILHITYIDSNIALGDKEDE